MTFWVQAIDKTQDTRQMYQSTAEITLTWSVGLSLGKWIRKYSQGSIQPSDLPMQVLEYGRLSPRSPLTHCISPFSDYAVSTAVRF